MKFLHIPLPPGIDGVEGFQEIFLERLMRLANGHPTLQPTKDELNEIINLHSGEGIDSRLRKTLDLLGNNTTADPLVIVLKDIDKISPKPLTNLLLILRDYHNQINSPATPGVKLRILVAGSSQLWKLCCYKTPERSPFNIAKRLFFDGLSREEIKRFDDNLNLEIAIKLKDLTDGIPDLIIKAKQNKYNFNELSDYRKGLQDNWFALPKKTQDMLIRVAREEERFPECLNIDEECPHIPVVGSPWEEAFWNGFLRVLHQKLVWRSLVHRAFVMKQAYSGVDYSIDSLFQMELKERVHLLNESFQKNKFNKYDVGQIEEIISLTVYSNCVEFKSVIDLLQGGASMDQIYQTINEISASNDNDFTAAHENENKIITIINNSFLKMRDNRILIDVITSSKTKRLYMLHISDIHLRTSRDVEIIGTQLITDLKKRLNIEKLDYVIISGDIGDISTEEEYSAACKFAQKIMIQFQFSSNKLIVVPGNHDINWETTKKTYRLLSKKDVIKPGESKYIVKSRTYARDEELYRKKFDNFNNYFYDRIINGGDYPLRFEEQAILHFFEDQRIIFLALNSCWEIDHFFKSRASINMDALSKALDRLMSKNYDDWLKIVVLHHPVIGKEMMDDQFLELLASHNFKVCMHGHIHKAKSGLFRYGIRNINIIGTGTFGSPAKDQVPGIPLQYNLLIYDSEKQVITVETRKKEEPYGAWSACPIYGDMDNPSSKYEIVL